ncbi:MAG: hypothetical protein M1828_000756 [Chrysothrix sp. TS-e1954]|nr:MAG: hypothetical protein M1828_000756 [Chrysothrix sp. TS-e1954]
MIFLSILVLSILGQTFSGTVRGSRASAGIPKSLRERDLQADLLDLNSSLSSFNFTTTPTSGSLFAPVAGPIIELNATSLESPSPPPQGNHTLASEGLYNLVSGEVDYPSPTNWTVLPNPLNASAPDLLGLGDLGNRSSTLQPRVTLTDGAIFARVAGDLWIKIYLGYSINKAVFEAVTDRLWAQINEFEGRHPMMRHSIDFYCDNLVTNTEWNYFAYLPPGGLKEVDTRFLRLAFGVLYDVLSKDPDTGLPRDAPFLARSWELLAKNGVTPILLGFFRQKFGSSGGSASAAVLEGGSGGGGR